MHHPALCLCCYRCRGVYTLWIAPCRLPLCPEQAGVSTGAYLMRRAPPHPGGRGCTPATPTLYYPGGAGSCRLQATPYRQGAPLCPGGVIPPGGYTQGVLYPGSREYPGSCNPSTILPQSTHSLQALHYTTPTQGAITCRLSQEPRGCLQVNPGHLIPEDTPLTAWCPQGAHLWQGKPRGTLWLSFLKI